MRFKVNQDSNKCIEDTKTNDTFLCYNEDIAQNLVDHLNKEHIGTSTSNIYEMTVLDLIKTKDQLVLQYTAFMADYRKKEAKLLIDTDFKELKLTNEKMRTAYINQQLSKEKYARANYEHNIDILNDLIRLRQKEVTP